MFTELYGSVLTDIAEEIGCEPDNEVMLWSIRDLHERIEFLTKMLTTRFARSSPIEEALLGIAMGKRPLPTREQCGEWAVKLGVPVESHSLLLKEETNGTLREASCHSCPSHA